MKNVLSIVALLLLFSCSCKKSVQKEIIRHDRPGAPILRGVFIPEGKEWFFTSGLVATVKDSTAAPETYLRYGNTYEQSVSTMKNIETTLALSGFTLDDVVQLRIYLAPGADGKIDWKGWFDAYQLFYNNETRASKVARTTLAVHSLARPDVWWKLRPLQRGRSNIQSESLRNRSFAKKHKGINDFLSDIRVIA